MLGEGNQNEYGYSDIKRPPSIGQIIGHKIKVHKAKMKMMRGASKPGQMAGMLSKSFSVVGAQSPRTNRLPGYPKAPGIDKVEPY